MGIEKIPDEVWRAFSDLRDSLAKEGLRVSWRDPFFCWVHEVPLPTEEGQPLKGPFLKFYIANPPIPKISPFDIATIEVCIDSFNRFHFELCLYYCSALDDKIEVEEIEKVHEEHDQKWLLANMEYLGPIAESYRLEWDVEYDCCICDTLHGSFEIKEANKILQILRDLIKMQSQPSG